MRQRCNDPRQRTRALIVDVPLAGNGQDSASDSAGVVTSAAVIMVAVRHAGLTSAKVPV